MHFRPGKCLLPQLMRERKLTSKELSDKLGLTIQEVSDHAHRRKVMSLPKAKLYANFFGIPIDDLYEWETTPSRKRSRYNTE